MPSKCKSGGEKHRQNSKVTAKSATTQIRVKKVMVAESAIKMESGGGKCHQTSKMMAKGATTFKAGGTLATISVIVVVH